jgi:hypothetical protein
MVNVTIYSIHGSYGIYIYMILYGIKSISTYVFQSLYIKVDNGSTGHSLPRFVLNETVGA